VSRRSCHNVHRQRTKRPRFQPRLVTTLYSRLCTRLRCRGNPLNRIHQGTNRLVTTQRRGRRGNSLNRIHQQRTKRLRAHLRGRPVTASHLRCRPVSASHLLTTRSTSRLVTTRSRLVTRSRLETTRLSTSPGLQTTLTTKSQPRGDPLNRIHNNSMSVALAVFAHYLPTGEMGYLSMRIGLKTFHHMEGVSECPVGLEGISVCSGATPPSLRSLPRLLNAFRRPRRHNNSMSVALAVFAHYLPTNF
jgi:hypothetical protein